MREFIDQAFGRATSILEAHRQLLDDAAQKLLEKETLSADGLPSLDEFHEINEADELHRKVG